MPVVFYYSRDGQPISREEAMVLYESPDARRVALDKIDEATLSTVHLVFDHNLFDGPPLIFETLIMGGPRDGEMLRYATESEARDGHAQLLAELTSVKQYAESACVVEPGEG